MPSSLALLEPRGLPASGGAGTLAAPASAEGGFKPFGDDGLTFDDILDILNPLHHLPVIGFLYRAATGDTISPVSKIAGGALFGGAIGFASSLADTVLKEASGKDAGGHLLALVRGDDTDGPLFPASTGPDKDRSWEASAQLRYDANEFEDWSETVPYPATAVASAGDVAGDVGGEEAGRGGSLAMLRYDDHDTDEDGWQAAAKPRSKELAASASQAPAAVTPPSSKIEPAARRGQESNLLNATPRAGIAGGQAVAGRTAAGMTGARLPAPRVLAANPAIVSAVQKGQSPYFHPGGTLNSDVWLKLMNNAGSNGKNKVQPTGAGGLAASTIAKALAKYGAAATPTVPAPAK